MLCCSYPIYGGRAVKRNTSKNIFALVVVLLVVGGLFAQTTTSGTIKVTGAWDGKKGIEAKAEAAYQVKIPMLAGEGPLFSGNNLKLKTQIGVSPIAATVTLDAVLTPVAVLEISLGGGAGTGWDFSLLDLEGLRIATGGLGTALSTDQFGGVYYLGRAGAAFQFDTGAIFKGDWTSVVIRAYQELNYKGYSNAPDGTAWEFETGGAMVNGFNYKGEYILGYQMPLIVNLVGVQLETYAYNVFDGSSLELFSDLSILANTQINDNLSLLTAIQFTNFEKTANRVTVKKATPAFKRVAMILSYAF